MPKRVWRLLRIEIAKIIGQKFLYFSLICAALITALGGYGCLLARQYSFEMNGYVTMIVSSLPGVELAAMFLVIFSAMTVASEYGGRTINSLLVRPVRRSEVLLAKLLLVLLFEIAFVTIIAGVGVLFGAIVSDFGDVKAVGYDTVIFTQRQMLHQCAIGYAVLLIPLFCIASMGFFFSVLITNVGAAIGASIGLYLLLLLLRNISALSRFLFTDYISFPMSIMSRMGDGIAPLWRPRLDHLLIVAGVYVAFFLTVSFLVFVRRDVTL